MLILASLGSVGPLLPPLLVRLLVDKPIVFYSFLLRGCLFFTRGPGPTPLPSREEAWGGRVELSCPRWHFNVIGFLYIFHFVK